MYCLQFYNLLPFLIRLTSFGTFAPGEGMALSRGGDMGTPSLLLSGVFPITQQRHSKA